MRQVFFSNGAPEAAGGDDASRFSDLVSNKLGLWDPYARSGVGDWFADALFENRFVIADTDGSSPSATLTSKRVSPLKQAFQVTQGFPSGNPLASPMIDTTKLVSIKCQGYEETNVNIVRVTPADGTHNTDEMQLKFVIKQHPTSYLGYVNGEANIFDFSGGGFDFPLSGFHANNHKLITIGYTAGSSVSASTTAIEAAVKNNTVLNAMINCNPDSSGAYIDFEARHPGTIFEVIQHNATDDTAAQSEVALQQAYNPGHGNAWQARADELKARAQAGNFNRMYFPDTFQDYVTLRTQDFDRFEITYKIDGDRDILKGSQFGTAVIYETDGTDASGLRVALNLGNALTAAGTEYLF